jgi:hypothetical protein
MNTETASRPMGDVLIARLCRFTTLDKIALGFVIAFVFAAAAAAALAYIAIGDAPEGRMWNILAEWAALGFVFGVAAPWAACRILHAAGHTARLAWDRRATAQTHAEPIAPFFQGRVA